jgi:hypothetical protein
MFADNIVEGTGSLFGKPSVQPPLLHLVKYDWNGATIDVAMDAIAGYRVGSLFSRIVAYAHGPIVACIHLRYAPDFLKFQIVWPL